MRGMEPAAVHALKQDDVSAGIDDRTGDRDPGLVGHVDGRRHDCLRALIGQALALGDIHSKRSSSSTLFLIVRWYGATIKQFSRLHGARLRAERRGSPNKSRARLSAASFNAGGRPACPMSS